MELVDRTPPPAGSGWTVILPLKGGPAAKSRLAGPPDLAAAIAFDCLDAVLATPGVARALVVTADRPTARLAMAAGAVHVHESHPGAGLLTAVDDGLRRAAWNAGPTAVLLADLPALRPTDLAEALRICSQVLTVRPEVPMAFVPDARGSGTVLLTARRPADLSPSFGPESAHRHAAAGAVGLALDMPRLRQDVDTPEDLAAALALGCGRRTTAVLGERRP